MKIDSRKHSCYVAIKEKTKERIQSFNYKKDIFQ